MNASIIVKIVNRGPAARGPAARGPAAPPTGKTLSAGKALSADGAADPRWQAGCRRTELLNYHGRRQ
jgi:hypothetical protein